MKEPFSAEEIRALVEGHKELGGVYDSPHKISPDTSFQKPTPTSSGKKVHKSHKKAEVTVLTKGPTNLEYQKSIQNLRDIADSNFEFK